MPVSETFIYQIEFEKGTISRIAKVDPVSSHVIKEEEKVFLFPVKHFITAKEEQVRAVKDIKNELAQQLKKFAKEGKLLEAERIKRRTNYDLAMIREIGYCNGIENYSRHMSGREVGEAPATLLSYFPHKNQDREYALRHSHSVLEGQVFSGRSEDSSKHIPNPDLAPDGNVSEPDFLTIIDESHVTLPQLEGMYAGDASRKNTLVEFGFRLPSAKDNRPLKINEFEERIGQVVYVSATPAEKERTTSEQIVEQIIRPTGLIDPEVVVRPVSEGKIFQHALRHSHSILEGQAFSGHSEDSSKHTEKFYPGQIQDFIAEAEKKIKKGFRVLATTLTKKMAEDLSLYLKDKKIKAEYLHSEIKTIERIQILTKLRKGEIDILVGVNLLREGLDLPEVALIGILDADKEGFLRSETSLIQTIGRAARNVEGKVILYADVMTGSMRRALDETDRRRAIQIAYNKKHGITPKTIIKKIKDITEELENKHEKAVNTELQLDVELFKKVFAKDKSNKGKNESDSIKNIMLSDEEGNKTVYEKIIKIKEKEMNQAVKNLDFETAAILRDEIIVLKEKVNK